METNMKDILEETHKEYYIFRENTMNKFSDYINKLNYENLEINKNHSTRSKDDVTIVKIEKHDDLSDLIYGSGFYIILTNYYIEENNCNLELDVNNTKVRAIYRGEGRRLKKRVESHLFNDKYQGNRDGTNYEVCIKIGDGNQGINIDKVPYNGSDFYVIQHKMTDSLSFERKIMEEVFDKKYNRPVCSRE